MQALEDSIVNFDKKMVVELTQTAISEIKDKKTIKPNEVVDGITRALERVGDLYQKGEYFLPELVYAGELAKTTLTSLRPFIIGKDRKKNDTVKIIILGTVQGDMHDLGKNIVHTFAEGAGYRIIDLGINVPKEKFIETLKEYNAKILGLSCLLTACDQELYNITFFLKEMGLEDVKVVIGGAAMTEKLANDVQETSGITTRFAEDAITGIKIFNELIQ